MGVVDHIPSIVLFFMDCAVLKEPCVVEEHMAMVDVSLMDHIQAWNMDLHTNLSGSTSKPIDGDDGLRRSLTPKKNGIMSI